MKDTDRAKLVEYVQKKYKTPATMPLEVSEAGFLPESCYRHLRFQSQDQRRPFQLELIASPDLRFLTREMLDSRVDPLEEERQKEKALLADLRREGGAQLGPKDAPVTITLFSDFQCPYCAQMANGLMKDILPAEADRVRLVFRNFPLTMHPWARPAAEAAECARTQGDKYFWSFHDYLFEHQKDMTAENLRPKLAAYGPDLAGFDVKAFESCVEERKTSAKVAEDLAMGRRIGITGTPTFFVNGTRITGYRAAEIRTLITQIADAPKKAAGSPEDDKQEPGACSGLKCERK